VGEGGFLFTLHFALHSFWSAAQVWLQAELQAEYSGDPSPKSASQSAAQASPQADLMALQAWTQAALSRDASTTNSADWT
jgi:hypothetical protein